MKFFTRGLQKKEFVIIAEEKKTGREEENNIMY
jgi:hypothetical protein